MDFISLFAGIGGLDLGLERAGMECVAQVEIDEFCQKILNKHWPNVPKYKDVKDVGKRNLPSAELVCGGFPCQPHSTAGKRIGSLDERDLWGEYFRIICETRPKWIVAENVLGLLSSENGRFFGGILRDLASIGYDAEWQVLPAAAFGSTTIRERVFIVSYPSSFGWNNVLQKEALHDRDSNRHAWKNTKTIVQSYKNESEYEGNPQNIRVGDGVPGWVDRLKGVGNSVSPQVAEFIGNCIISFSKSHNTT